MDLVGVSDFAPWGSNFDVLVVVDGANSELTATARNLTNLKDLRITPCIAGCHRVGRALQVSAVGTFQSHSPRGDRSQGICGRWRWQRYHVEGRLRRSLAVMTGPCHWAPTRIDRYVFASLAAYAVGVATERDEVPSRPVVIRASFVALC